MIDNYCLFFFAIYQHLFDYYGQRKSFSFLNISFLRKKEARLFGSILFLSTTKMEN